MAPAPLEPVRLQHLQGSAQSEEPICQSTPSSTIHKSCGASQNLATTFGAIWNSSTAGSQLSALTRPSNAWLCQQSTIHKCHAKDQQFKCDMAWVEFFYSANIPFGAV
jgi:hypothetical protein